MTSFLDINHFLLPLLHSHNPVWAKQKGFPHWPAKLFKRYDVDGEPCCDVRFFGRWKKWIKFEAFSCLNLKSNHDCAKEISGRAAYCLVSQPPVQEMFLLAVSVFFSAAIVSSPAIFNTFSPPNYPPFSVAKSQSLKTIVYIQNFTYLATLLGFHTVCQFPLLGCTKEPWSLRRLWNPLTPTFGTSQ